MRRDAFGERPLYFVEAGGGFRAASSVARLLSDAGLPRALDPDAAASALCGDLDQGHSLFRGVHRVPPGHELRLEGGRPRVVPWWEPPLPSGTEADAGARQEDLLRLLRAAIRRRSGAGRAACTLSGGMDSAGVLALLAATGARVRAFTLADDFGDGEIERARDLASRFGAEHVVVPVSEEDLPAGLVETVVACEDLIWNGRAVASHRLFRGIREAGETVVLSGAGADEILCGNPSALWSFEERLEAESALARSLLTGKAASSLRPRARPAPPGVDALVARQLAFLRTVLPESTLVPECRASAAEGVEVRLPYLDLDVAELCLRLPPPLRARGGTGKVLLREALRGLLPEDLLARPKTPRLAPAAGRVARAREAWLALYHTWLTPERVSATQVLEPSRVRALLEELSGLAPDDRRRAVTDAVLMKSASLVILQKALARTAA